MFIGVSIITFLEELIEFYQQYSIKKTTFSDEINVFSRINRNIYKPPVAEETKNIVRKNFTREIEFFEYCKQRLHKQYLALRLDTNP